VRSLGASSPRLSRWLPTSLLVLAGLSFLLALWDIASTTSLGENDFVGYWSAAYLLRDGQNPYNPELMKITQQTKLHTRQDSTIMAWNPPTLFVFLLPLTWLSFIQAKYAWLLVNLTMIVTSAIRLVNIYLPVRKPKHILVILLFVMIFPPVLAGIFMGQVTFLVFFGLVFCITLIKKEKWFWAGASLILTTIKPHLVILPALYIFVLMAVNRKLNGWIGFIVAGCSCAIALFLLRPLWIQDLIGLSTIAPVQWATPTIGGLIRYLGISNTARYLIILFLPLPFLLVRHRNILSMELSVALLTLLTIPVTFFGWSYDQTLLLIPIIQVFSWLTQPGMRSIKATGVLAIILAVGFNIYQRAISTNDVYYVCVPLFWWLLFGLTWYFISPLYIKHE